MKRLTRLCGLCCLVLGSIFFVQHAHAADLVINEFVAAPSVGNPEWVEFYNASDSADFLKSYYLDDDTSFDSDTGSSPKKLLTNLNVSDVHHPFFVLTSSMFNNDGDMVVLFDPSGNVIDQFTYFEDPGSDVSIGRYPDQVGPFMVLTSATQGKENAPPPSPTPKSTATPIPQPTNTPTITPTSTCTPTPTYSPTPTRAPTLTPIQIVSTEEATTESEVSVLGEEITPKIKPVATVSGRSLKPIIISITLVGIGMAILSGVFVWKKRNE